MLTTVYILFILKSTSMQESSPGTKIGRYIRYQREKRSWPLREYAEKAGVTPSFLSRLETGNYKSLSLEILKKLADGFTIPLYEFLHKCQIVQADRISLPDLEFYLREKYQLP